MSEPARLFGLKLGPCPFCNYNLAGSATGGCPECGRPVYRFTDRARVVFVLANQRAVALYRHDTPEEVRAAWWKAVGASAASLRPLHVLIGIAAGPPGVGFHALTSCGADPARLLHHAQKRAAPFHRLPLDADARLPFHPRTRSFIRFAINEAFRRGHHWVGTEHLLLALTRDRASRALLARFGATRAKLVTFVEDNARRVAAAANLEAASARV